jgi:hypothetical protein
MTTQFMIKPTTTDYTSKGEAYRTLFNDAEPEATDESLEYLGVLAARKAVMWIGQYYGLNWMETHKGWKRDEWMRACLAIEETLGRSLTGFQRDVVWRGMRPILDDAI